MIPFGELLEAYKEESTRRPKNKRDILLMELFHRPAFVYRVRSEDIYRIIEITLNPNTMNLYCDVYEDNLKQPSDAEKYKETSEHRFHIQSDCTLKKLEDSEDNRLVVTKQVSPC